ncbi:MAG: hypothetical protein HQK54_03035 [Oligoflexales bacterium]|nr:hypothetical protein [Oligoflexales bacterium]
MKLSNLILNFCSYIIMPVFATMAILSCGTNKHSDMENTSLTSDAGGYGPIDVENPDVIKAANFAVNEINAKKSNNEEDLTLDKIVSAESQVVAGIKYKMVLNLNGKKPETHEVVVFSGLDNTMKLMEDTVKSGDEPTGGGYKEIDVKDPKVTLAANFAVMEINGKNKNGRPLFLDKIVSAKSQVVSGTNYKMVLDLKGEKPETHEVVVFYGLDNTMELTQDNLIPDKDDSSAGAYKPISTDDTEIVKAANFAVKAINERPNSGKPPAMLKKIVSAEYQLVAGKNYKMVLRLQRGSNTETHEVVVFSRLGTGAMELTSDIVKFNAGSLEE